jgi:hypothetical protein
MRNIAALNRRSGHRLRAGGGTPGWIQAAAAPAAHVELTLAAGPSIRAHPMRLFIMKRGEVPLMP